MSFVCLAAPDELQHYTNAHLVSLSFNTLPYMCPMLVACRGRCTATLLRILIEKPQQLQKYYGLNMPPMFMKCHRTLRLFQIFIKRKCWLIIPCQSSDLNTTGYYSSLQSHKQGQTYQDTSKQEQENHGYDTLPPLMMEFLQNSLVKLNLL